MAEHSKAKLRRARRARSEEGCDIASQIFPRVAITTEHWLPLAVLVSPDCRREDLFLYSSEDPNLIIGLTARALLDGHRILDEVDDGRLGLCQIIP